MWTHNVGVWERCVFVSQRSRGGVTHSIIPLFPVCFRPITHRTERGLWVWGVMSTRFPPHCPHALCLAAVPLSLCLTYPWKHPGADGGLSASTAESLPRLDQPRPRSPWALPRARQHAPLPSCSRLCTRHGIVSPGPASRRAECFLLTLGPASRMERLMKTLAGDDCRGHLWDAEIHALPLSRAS